MNGECDRRNGSVAAVVIRGVVRSTTAMEQKRI